MKGNILVIDNNPLVKDAIEQEWRKHGYELVWVNEFSLAAMELKSGRRLFCLIALTADYLGEALVPTLSLLRDVTTMPILVLSTEYCAQIQMKTLALGADVYLQIPATLEEGVAVGLALIRRFTHYAQQNGEKLPLIFSGELFISPEHRRVFFKEREIRLTRLMFDLLLFLARHENRMVTYDEVYEAVWGDTYNPETNNNQIWCAVNRLRKMFRAISETPDYIKTERHVGYRFTTIS